MKKLIVIADWATDSLSCQEFRSVYGGYLTTQSQADLSFISTYPSSINTGFIANQIQLIETRYGRANETVIFINTDPRLDNGQTEFKKSPFIIARLSTDLFVCGPNAEFSFSFIRKYIKNLYIYSGLEQKGQFRSRDIYSRVCAHLVEEMEDEMDLEEAQFDIIPILNKFYIGHIDNFNNIKTTIPTSFFKGKFEYNNVVNIEINNITKSMKFGEGLFSGDKNKLKIYPGSSGEKNDPYLEISFWRNFKEEKKLSATHLFNNPTPGSEITIK